MTLFDLPLLPAGVKFLGRPDGPDEATELDGGLEFKVLWARYEIGGLSVRIGWTVDHVMGSFRAPNRLHIDFDSFDYGTKSEAARGFAPEQAFDGVTTQILRSIPMAHARALMRERYEQLFVLSLHEALSPLPSRVETDRDYVHAAMAYVALVNGGSIEPLKRLSEWTNESDDTWSARLRRARTRGVLLGKGRQAQLSSQWQKTADEIWAELSNARRAANGNH